MTINQSGWRPTTPQAVDGERIEPLVSVPTATAP
mgnify:CR=1 FL=1